MRADLRLIESSPRLLVNRLLSDKRNVAVDSWTLRLQFIYPTERASVLPQDLQLDVNDLQF
jgi:hypothetical protein